MRETAIALRGSRSARVAIESDDDSSVADAMMTPVPLGPTLDAFRHACARIGRLTGARAEASLYGDFQQFLVDAAAELGHADINVVPQMSKGRLVPDYGLFRRDNHMGWVELKAPDKDLDSLSGHDARQHDRMLQDLEAFVLTNGWDWRFFVNGRLQRKGKIAASILRTPTAAVPSSHLTSVADVLDAAFSRAPTTITAAEEATTIMAFRARAIRRDVAVEMASPPPVLLELYEDFENLVYKSGREYNRADFADAYAQTAIFGMLLARLTTGATLRLDTAASGISATEHPFLFRCLSIMTDASLGADLRTVLQEAVTAINRIPPRIFKRATARDPLLYAYEDFFAVYDPDERAARGVYYTPPFVVSHQVRGIEELLKSNFGFTGLQDPNVRFLDPATGTGTYLLGVLEHAAASIASAGGAVDVELASMVIDRVRAFELMVGPYTVSHQRLATMLRDEGVVLGSRLPIYLVDTLAEALSGAVHASRFGALGAELEHEREAAEHVKTTEPILVVLGNPPYDRIKRDQLGDHWLLERISDMVARTPAADRRQIHPIYDFYVAFWRWALWLVAERAGGFPGKGIVSYITNRSWLIGRTFGGMRSLFTELCSEIYVVDLGGDLRTSGTIRADQNVFDVGVGVAIVFAVVDSAADELASVFYRREIGSRADKESALALPIDLSANKFEAVTRADAIAPFLPVGWGVLEDSPGIEDLFIQHETGVQTSRDSLVVGVRREDILDGASTSPSGSVGEWSQLTGHDREERFHPTRTHRQAPRGAPSPTLITRYAYRPLDYRHLYNDPAFIEWPRPDLQLAFSQPNVALVTIERGFGAGPAAFPVNALPDLHAFRGFGGSRGVYPLLAEGVSSTAKRRRRRRSDDQLAVGNGIALAPNFTDGLKDWAMRSLAGASSEDIFAYLCAVLGAPAYVIQFEERGLIAERPRVPLTLKPDLAAEAVGLGHQLLELWTLQRPPGPDVSWAPGAHTAPFLGPATYDAAASAISVADRELLGVPAEVWAYEVSGLRVLPRYFEDREAQPGDAAGLTETRTVVSALRGIVELESQLDDLLNRILASPLESKRSF